MVMLFQRLCNTLESTFIFAFSCFSKKPKHIYHTPCLSIIICQSFILPAIAFLFTGPFQPNLMRLRFHKFNFQLCELQWLNRELQPISALTEESRENSNFSCSAHFTRQLKDSNQMISHPWVAPKLPWHVLLFASQ